MATPCDVYLCYKNLTVEGLPTRDSEIAHDLYRFLEIRGLRVFFSPKSLEQHGVADFKMAIDDALDETSVVIAVGTTPENLQSKWVRYEWDSFFKDILTDIKPHGRVFTYTEGVAIKDLPRALRQVQCFDHGAESMENLYRYIRHALSAAPPPHTNSSGVVSTDSGVSGEWEGSWKRETANILHRGRLSLFQTGDDVRGTLEIEFEKRGARTRIEEKVFGAVHDDSLVLNGTILRYLEQGNSTSYLLDHFGLNLVEDGAALTGVFYSRKGRGTARFVRSRPISVSDRLPER